MATPDQQAPELRIHGVSGSPGPRLLGFESLSAVKTLDPLDSDTGNCVVRRRRDTQQGVIDGFDWGNVHASGRVAFWIFLLPFTLVNAAGWMLPKRRERTDGGPRWSGGQWLVGASGLTLTLTWVVWMVNVVVGYLAYQVLPARFGAPAMRTPLVDLELSPWASRLVAVGAAYAVVVGVFGYVAWRSATAEDRLTWTESSQGMAFFGRPDSPWTARAWAHFGLGFALVGASVWPTVRALQDETPAIDFAGMVLVVGVVQTVVVATLWLLAFTFWIRRRSFGSFAGAVTLACLLTGAFLSGVGYWVVATLPGLLDFEPSAIERGSELGAVDAYGWGLLAGLGVAALAVSRVRGHADTTDPSQLRGRWKSTARAVERRAWLARRTGAVLSWFAFFAGAVLVALTAWDFDLRNGVDLRESNGGMARFMQWALPLGVGFLVAQVAWSTIRESSIRKVLGTTWDVLAFFPRDHHPLAVRCYSAEVVPRLGHAIAARVEAPGNTLVISAHSQGSVLAFAALAGLEPFYERISLVTYGSPLGTLYRANFPSLFDATAAAEVRDGLGGRWRNFYRRTDPIGGPVDVTGETIDVRLDDPATANTTFDPASAPLEHDREPWIEIAAHSHYLREQALKAYVRTARRELVGAVTKARGRRPRRRAASP